MKYWQSPFAAAPLRFPDFGPGGRLNTGSLAIPEAIPDNISDDKAIHSLLSRNQNLPIPLTFTPQQNLMRRKMSYPSTPSSFGSYPLGVDGLGAPIVGVGPLAYHSLRMLSPFSAFSDDTTDTAGADIQYSDVTLDTTGAGDNSGAASDFIPVGTNPNDVTASGANLGTSLLNALPGLVSSGTNIFNAVNGRPATVTVAAKPTVATVASSMTPILLIGGVAVIFMLMSRRGGSRSRR